MFYFGHDWSQDADELYQFFLVQDGKIGRESFALRSASAHEIQSG
jgi:hypothetical protein